MLWSYENTFCAYVVVLLWTCIEDWHGREEIVEWSHYFCFLFAQKYSRSFIKLCLNHWCHRLFHSLLPFWALNVVVVLLSMEGQKTLGFYQKYLNLCSEGERRSYGFGTTWGWVINDWVFIFVWTMPLKTNTHLREFARAAAESSQSLCKAHCPPLWTEQQVFNRPQNKNKLYLEYS